MKHKSILLMAILVIPLFFATGVATAEELTVTQTRSISPRDSGIAKLAGSLRDAIHSSDSVDVIFEMNDDAAGFAREIQASGGRVTAQLSNAEILAATVPSNTLLRLSLSEKVARIYKDQTIQLPSDIGMKGEAMMESLDSAVSFKTLSEPMMHANAFLTDAADVWGQTNAGDGQVIAVIDTGVLPHVLLGSRLIGGVDLTWDVGTLDEGYDNPNNIGHGTFVATQAAANGIATFSGSLADSLLAHNPYATLNPDGTVDVPLLGSAPLASIYAVKVFSAWGYTTTATILQGIDHAVSIGADVINLSIGGWTTIPGEDPLDVMVDAATAAGVTVTVSASNDGPNPLEIASPGTSMSAITVGAASTPMQERIYGDFVLGTGLGEFYYSHDEKSIVYFSSRGPTSDGRAKPDLVASGSHNLGGEGYYDLYFGSGTSFSSPVVAGGAALISAYGELNGMDLSPADIKKALVDGAEPIPGYTAFEQGAGYMNLQNSIASLVHDDHREHRNGRHREHKKEKHHDDDTDFSRGKIADNVEDLLPILELDDGVATFSDVTINPATFAYFTFEVGMQVDFVKVDIDGVWFDQGNPELGNRGWGYMSTTMSNGDGGYWDLIFIDEGDHEMWTGEDFGFQAGVVRVTFENDFISWGVMHIDTLTISVVEAKLEAEDGGLEIENEGAASMLYLDVWDGSMTTVNGHVLDGSIDIFTFTIPDAYGLAFLELSWKRDYSWYGTDDLDFYVWDSYGWWAGSGAGYGVPETDYVLFADTYEVWVVGYNVYDPAGTDYKMKIMYISDYFGAPVYSSSLMLLGQDEEMDVQLPAGVSGLAILGTLNAVNYWGSTFYVDYFADFAEI